MDAPLPPVPTDFVPQAPIDVPPPVSKIHPYAQKLMGPFLTVLVLGILTIGSGVLLYTKRNQSVAPTNSHASAQTTIFDTFDGTALDNSKWTVYPASAAAITNNMVQLTSASPSGSMVYTQGITGDYTLEVTMDSITPNSSADLYVQRWNNPADEAVNLIGWNKTDSAMNVEMYNRVNSQYSDPHPVVALPDSTTSVRLKLVRTGSVIQGFADYGSGYQLLGSISDAWTGDGTITLAIWGNPASVSFDSFTGQVTLVGDIGPTPTPTSTPTAGEPNTCGGTCGSNANCGNGLFCYQGYCRNYLCATASNCVCASPTPTPYSTPMATPISYSPPPFASPTPEVITFTGTPTQTYSYVPAPTPLDLTSLIETTPAPVVQPSLWQRFVNFWLRLFKINY